jgi:hypothetical protein
MRSRRQWLLAATIHGHEAVEGKRKVTGKREEEDGLVGTSKGRKKELAKRRKKKKKRDRREGTHRLLPSFQLLKKSAA